MKLSDEERIVIEGLEMEKARSFMNEADITANLELWDLVLNRLYYSLFHAATALLIHVEKSASSHKGAIVQFNKYFVKSGIIDPEMGHTYAMLQGLRERADYNCRYQAQAEDVKPLILSAKQLLTKIGELLLKEKSELPISED